MSKFSNCSFSSSLAWPAIILLKNAWQELGMWSLHSGTYSELQDGGPRFHSSCLLLSSFGCRFFLADILERANSLSWFPMLTAMFCITSSKTPELLVLALSSERDKAMHFKTISFLKDSILSSSGQTMYCIPGIFPCPMLQAHNVKLPPWVTACSSLWNDAPHLQLCNQNIVQQKEPKVSI